MGRKFEVRKAAMAKTMLKKSKLYSRYGKEIYMIAKSSGANPDSNLSLKHLIDKGCKKKVFHKNKAARKKSQLALALKSI